MQGEDGQGRNQIPKLDKFHEIELDKWIDGIISMQNLRLQAGVFFGTMNLAALGVALSTQNALVVTLAGVLLWLFILVDMGARVICTAYCYHAMKLQVRYAPNDDGFMHMLPGSAARWARGMMDLYEREEQDPSPSRLPLGRLRTQSKLGFWLPLAVSLVQIVTGVLLWLVLDWSLL